MIVVEPIAYEAGVRRQGASGILDSGAMHYRSLNRRER